MKKPKLGRPPKPPEERSVAYRFTLTADVNDALDLLVERNPYPSRSAAVAALIRAAAKRLRGRQSARS